MTSVPTEATPALKAQHKNTLYCSFCGKSQYEVDKLIAGPTVFICDECVVLCMDIIFETQKAGKKKTGLAGYGEPPFPERFNRVVTTPKDLLAKLTELEEGGEFKDNFMLASMVLKLVFWLPTEEP